MFLALTPHLLFLILLFGVVLPIAMGGSSLTTTAALLAKWFHRHRTTAVALNASGASVGGLLLVPLTALLIQLVGWRMAWVVLGLLLILVAVPLAYALLPMISPAPSPACSSVGPAWSALRFASSGTRRGIRPPPTLRGTDPTPRLDDAERERLWVMVAAKEAGLSIWQIARATGVRSPRVHHPGAVGGAVPARQASPPTC